jgi:toxin ParE1/3/4
MRIEYSQRAVADLRKISADSPRAFGERVAEALEARIRSVAERIAREPLSSPEVEQRPGMRVAPLVRYPFKIFYRILNDRVRILHIRHSARQSWRGGA